MINHFEEEFEAFRTFISYSRQFYLLLFNLNNDRPLSFLIYSRVCSLFRQRNDFTAGSGSGSNIVALQDCICDFLMAKR